MLKVKISTLVTWGGLLVLAQLLVTQWTVRAAGNRDVIDYISFAGTVVGMILAVLAIVYSYLANASQKNDADSIRSQVTSLNDAIARADISGNRFSDEVQRLQEIRDSLSVVASTSSESLETARRTEQQLMLLNGRDKHPARQQPQIQGVDRSAFFVAIGARAAHGQVVQYYLAIKKKSESPENYKKLEEDLLFSAIKESPTTVWLRCYTQGETNGYYWIFYDMGFFESVELQKEFRRALIDHARTLEAKDFAIFDGEKLKASIDKCIVFMEEEIVAAG